MADINALTRFWSTVTPRRMTAAAMLLSAAVGLSGQALATAG